MLVLVNPFPDEARFVSCVLSALPRNTRGQLTSTVSLKRGMAPPKPNQAVAASVTSISDSSLVELGVNLELSYL